MMFLCQKCGAKAQHWKRCDEHYACDDCGTREGLCTHTEGVLCERCHTVRIENRVVRFKGSTSYTSEVICPHCGYTHHDSWELSEGERDCPDCNRTFELSRYVEVVYTTTKSD
jgi:hypothetical protein